MTGHGMSNIFSGWASPVVGKRTPRRERHSPRADLRPPVSLYRWEVLTRGRNGASGKTGSGWKRTLALICILRSSAIW